MYNPPLCYRQSGQLLHLSLDRPRARLHALLPDPWFVADMTPLLTSGQGPVPGSPEVFLNVDRGFDCARFLVAIRGSELLTAGVAWGPSDRWGLFAFLVTYYEESKGATFPSDRRMPLCLPWLGTVGSPLFGELSRHDRARLLGWTRRFAIAIMSHALTIN